MERNEIVVAIDLGTSKIAMLVGKKSVDGKLEILASSMSDSLSGVVRGEIKNTEQISKALKETTDHIEKELGITIRQACVGVSGQHIKTLNHSGYIFIENSDGEVRQRDVLRLNESMNNIQIPIGETIIQILPQEYRLDDEPDVREPVGMIGNKLEASFNIVVGDKAAVGRIDKTLSKDNISAMGHYLNALASAEAVLIPDEKELGVCVVDIGGGTTDVCICHDNIIRHVAVIPLGGNVINKDIRSYGILERRVESLKVKFGGAVGRMERADKFITIPGLSARDPKEISCRNLSSIIEARLLDIIDSVKHEIKSAGYEGRLGAGIVLTGGVAQTRNIDVLFRSHTGYDVRVALPDTHVTEMTAELVNSPAYSVAVGLLMKGLGLSGSSRSTGTRPLVKTTSAAVVQPSLMTEKEEKNHSETAVENARSTHHRRNEPANAWRDDPQDKPSDPEPEETGRKGNWFQWVKERLTGAFEVVDDDFDNE